MWRGRGWVGCWKGMRWDGMGWGLIPTGWMEHRERDGNYNTLYNNNKYTLLNGAEWVMVVLVFEMGDLVGDWGVNCDVHVDVN